jgi:hypothetical protein
MNEPIDLPTDSDNYEVLFHAAQSIKNVEGIVCEIGTRRGGGTKVIIDGLLSVNDCNRNIVCVDPYGNIDYHSNETHTGKSDYTNDMRNDAAINLYRYVKGKPINLVLYCLEDTEYFDKFKNGVPFYNDVKSVVNQYSLVFFDGPHCSSVVLKEVEFFLPRTVSGSRFVFDDVCDYNHELIHQLLTENNFAVVESVGRKTSYIKQ